MGNMGRRCSAAVIAASAQKPWPLLLCTACQLKSYSPTRSCCIHLRSGLVGRHILIVWSYLSLLSLLGNVVVLCIPSVTPVIYQTCPSGARVSPCTIPFEDSNGLAGLGSIVLPKKTVSKRASSIYDGLRARVNTFL